MLADPAFLAVVSTTGLLSLCWGLVSTALPLWLVRDTHLPAGLAGVVVIVNSLGVALLQVVASRGCTGPRRGAARAVWSGAALALACLLFAATGGGSGAIAVGLVLLAAAAHLAGELWFIAAKWALTLDLTPPGATGRYQGLAATHVGPPRLVRARSGVPRRRAGHGPGGSLGGPHPDGNRFSCCVNSAQTSKLVPDENMF
ncbi:hypothetical protein [Amycolatopsis methanolica]|uniref:Putative major facilitator superfamily (MFS) transporter n=1 Tax=Amycolatopsis methanolica 239 TaxID=1068978 RepID=A0A076N0A9_AMYME|nr:hypothetical protein [Amycolatopsis methanolica]AIJ24561.1 putative major facilitator superfamily (MFS) transporter [Amycolatopsis methanolica 239]